MDGVRRISPETGAAMAMLLGTGLTDDPVAAYARSYRWAWEAMASIFGGISPLSKS